MDDAARWESRQTDCQSTVLCLNAALTASNSLATD